MEEAMKQSSMRFVAGEIVKGTVIEVRPKEVLVDIGYKSEGIIPAEEFSQQELATLSPGTITAIRRNVTAEGLNVEIRGAQRPVDVGDPAAGRPGSTSLSVISPAPGLRADPPSLTAI